MNILQRTEEKKMSKKYHVKRREFLSKSPDSGACVIATVEDARERHVREPDSDRYQEISLHITDDTDGIWFYFDLYTIEDREDTLHKIRTLVEVITEFKRAVELEVEVINARLSIPKHARVSEAVH